MHFFIIVLLKLSKQKHSIWPFEKIKICFAVNALLELLNYWVYIAYEKEVVAPKFSTEKNSPMTSPFLVTECEVVSLNFY